MVTFFQGRVLEFLYPHPPLYVNHTKILLHSSFIYRVQSTKYFIMRVFSFTSSCVWAEFFTFLLFDFISYRI